MDGAAVNPLVILGATGSIGRQTLEVADRLEIPVAAVAARRGSDELLSIATSHPDAMVAVAAPTEAEKERFAAKLGGRVVFGADSLSEMAGGSGRTVVNGIVGAAGLAASVAALTAGNRLALANKESLVAGGPVLRAAREQGGGELIPVDSEHSALMQCLAGEDLAAVRRLILTASGGPFRGRDADSLAEVTVAEALAHPTWAMGPRITIDSATLMNKGLEVIEAHWLYDVPYDQIEVIVHPQSLVHSFVEFVDGSLKAQLGLPDMRIPIQYSVTFPQRTAGPAPRLELTEHPQMSFEAPDPQRFPAISVARAAGIAGPGATAALIAADDIAVERYLAGSLTYRGLAELVEAAVSRFSVDHAPDLEELEHIDADVRAWSRQADVGGTPA